jgi:glucuronate isomerase
MFDDNFMLKGETSGWLYHGIAKNAPIYDFHCHLSPKEIYEDKEFSNISKIFLAGDHYKWRAMRYAGVPERFITGDGDDFEKFRLWAKTCERLIGSPLYHWTNLELRQFFGVQEPLKEKNAREIYDYCNRKISEEGLSPVKLIRNSRVKLICTTDDPADDLMHHRGIAEKNYDFQVLPTFRPDRALNLQKADYMEYLRLLSESSNTKISSYGDLITALRARIDYFHENGTVLSDHSLESLCYAPAGEHEIAVIFHKRCSGSEVTEEEAQKFRNHTLKLLAIEYHRRGWVMQLHIGAMRSNNEVMLERLGADTGYDIMNDFVVAPHLSKLLNDMNREQALPKTVLYNLNPKDNIVLSALPHCFSEDQVPGKLQLGAAWWFLDHKEGMTEHLKAISSQGMLAYFIGMLTDSRSFLSYARHDYFRRILCSYIGSLVDEGEYEKDEKILTELVEGICYRNIKQYLNLI